jgi:hypothetical protein
MASPAALASAVALGDQDGAGWMTEAGDTAAGQARGVSSYATGGGCVSLERRVATIYLARVLTGCLDLGNADISGDDVPLVDFGH